MCYISFWNFCTIQSIEITWKGEYLMVADTILTVDNRTQKREDRSATIFVVGRVSYVMGIVQLDPQTRLYCRRAVGEYYERTKIINRRKNCEVVSKRTTNDVYLVMASFEKEEEKKNQIIEQIRSCFACYEDIPEDHIIDLREEKSSLEDVVVAIQEKRLPSNVIVMGNAPFFTKRNPLEMIFKKGGIVPEYLSDDNLLVVFPF